MDCATHEASLSFAIPWSLLKLVSIDLVMSSNHLILCQPFLLLSSVFPASGSFPVSQFFTSGGQIIGASASASVLPMYIQSWFPLGSTGLISLLPKGLSKVFSSTSLSILIPQFTHPPTSSPCLHIPTAGSLFLPWKQGHIFKTRTFFQSTLWKRSFSPSTGPHGLGWREVWLVTNPKRLWLKGRKSELGKWGFIPAPPLKAVSASSAWKVEEVIPTFPGRVAEQAKWWWAERALKKQAVGTKVLLSWRRLLWNWWLIIRCYLKRWMCDHITKRSFFVVVALFLMISREALSRDSPGVSQKLGDPLSEHTLEPLLNFLQIFAPKLLYSTGSSVMGMGWGLRGRL